MNDKPLRGNLIPPHGGELKPLLIEGPALTEARRRAASLPCVRLSSRETSDLIMMAMGAFSPLTGFLCRRDYLGVRDEMRMENGTFWPVPITLCLKDNGPSCKAGDRVALVDDETGTPMGSMLVEDRYAYDKSAEAARVFGTEDAAHPGVAKIYEQGDTLIGGPVEAFCELDYPARFGGYYARPGDTRRIFAERGWNTIAAFQTRNPIHRSHEYCTKIALEIVDGLLIHPLVGKLKADDIPAEIRMRCYESLLEKYYPADRVLCRVYPMEMRYAGPREALLHGVFRQNFGCSHLIIGRDHAGVGNYYGPFDAQKIFERIGPDDLLIKPLNIDWTFWCRKCEGMASTKTCPHAPEHRILISGTELRTMLADGRIPPREFTRPEVAEILIAYYRDLAARDESPQTAP